MRKRPASSDPSPSTRDRALDAAAVLWKERGGGGFTMDELSARTGVSRVTLYRAFAGRGAVLAALAAERGVAAAADAGDDSRARIVRAARKVLLELGPDRATVERIAAEAGVGTATVYRHFVDKDGLVSAVIEASTPRRFARELGLSGGEDFEAELVRFVEQLVGFVRANAGGLRFVLGAAHDQPELVSAMVGPSRRTYQLVARYLDGLVRAGRLRAADTELAATALIGQAMVFAWIAPALKMPAPQSPRRIARAVVSLWLDGLRPAEPRRKKPGKRKAE